MNFPSGEVRGWEFEARQGLGRFFEPLRGLTLGGNATLLDTEVTLRGFESDQLAAVGAPQTTADMTNAPDLLYNLFLTYDNEPSGTKLSVFYTVRGDTLIATPGVANETGGGRSSSYPVSTKSSTARLTSPLRRSSGSISA